jgi:hypothetical protein
MFVVKYTSCIKHRELKIVEFKSHYNHYIWSQANQDKGAVHSVGGTIHRKHFPTSCGVLP